MHALRAPARSLSRPPTSSPRSARQALAPPPSASLALTTTASTTALRLLEAVAPLDRGALARPQDAARVEDLARALEAESPAASFNRPAGQALAGRWRLAYVSSPAVFRASVFFDAFSNAVGERAVAEAVFKFTNELPMARVGGAWQTIQFNDDGNSNSNSSSNSGGKLVSEVELAVGELPYFPGLRGVVESTAAIDGVAVAPSATSSSAYRLDMTMRSTRVVDSLFSALGGDQIVAPVEQLLERLRGPEAARVCYLVTALSGDVRVTRAEGTGLLMVHVREP